LLGQRNQLEKARALLTEAATNTSQ
jgi:hypothetical protein